MKRVRAIIIYVGSYAFEWVNIFDLNNYDLRPVEIKNIVIKKIV